MGILRTRRGAAGPSRAQVALLFDEPLDRVATPVLGFVVGVEEHFARPVLVPKQARPRAVRSRAGADLHYCRHPAVAVNARAFKFAPEDMRNDSDVPP